VVNVVIQNLLTIKLFNSNEIKKTVTPNKHYVNKKVTEKVSNQKTLGNEIYRKKCGFISEESWRWLRKMYLDVAMFQKT